MTDELAAIRRPFGPDELAPKLTAASVDRTVLVQTRSSVDETRELLAIAADTPFIAGVVGWVDLTSASVADAIASLRRSAGGDHLVGVRHQVHDEPDAEWLGRADVRRGLRAVADAGLVYDLLVRSRELPAATDAARAMPELRFVLDHAAKPAIATHEVQPWGGLVEELAQLPNVTCKLSGLLTEADWATWTVDDLRPYADHVLSVFGPSRTMFGSDWPVSLLAADYERVVATARDLTVALRAAEAERVFGGTAIETYRLAA
jgi:L-fuconolactonase